MGFPFDFIGEDEMTELSNSANKAFIAQRTTGFGSDDVDFTPAVNTRAVKENTGGDLFPVQPLIAQVGVAIGGNVIDLELLKGGADMPRPAQGSFTVEGDLVVNATVRNGMESIHRNIAQDPDPDFAYAGGGGTFPSEWTIVPAAEAFDATASVVDHSANIATKPAAIKYEVEPTVTLSETPALASGALEGVVTIEGTDRNGTNITRVARYTASDITGTKFAKKVGGFFNTITGVFSKGFSAGMVKVSAKDESTKITFNPDDRRIIDYIDLEIDIGNVVPFGFYAGVINGVGFNFARDEVVQYTAGCLFGDVNIRKNLANADTVPTLPSGVAGAIPEVFVGTQCEVEVDGVVIPLETAALNLSQSYIASPYIGKTIYPKKPRRSGYRTLNLNLGFPATEENNWLQYFEAHADFEDVIVRAKNGVIGTQGQFGGIIEWHFNQLVLSEAPSIATAGQDTASQSAVLMPYSNDENAAFNINSIQSEYDKKLFKYA